jgi:hypothetical protein
MCKACLPHNENLNRTLIQASLTQICFHYSSKNWLKGKVKEFIAQYSKLSKDHPIAIKWLIMHLLCFRDSLLAGSIHKT